MANLDLQLWLCCYNVIRGFPSCFHHPFHSASQSCRCGQYQHITQNKNMTQWIFIERLLSGRRDGIFNKISGESYFSSSKDAYTAAFSQTYTQPACHLSAPRHSNIWEEMSSITTGCDNHWENLLQKISQQYFSRRSRHDLSKIQRLEATFHLIYSNALGK